MNSFYENRFVGVWSETYIRKLAFKIAIALLIVGGINWLLVGLLDINIVSTIFGKNSLTTFIYVLVGISAIAIMFDRDTYLPFLGPAVIPCSVLEVHDPPGATREVKIHVEPNVKIIYWAAEPASDEKLKSWKHAYLDYQNAGVAISNGNGEAVLKIREPQSYKVPLMGKLPQHVHYRVCGEAGWVSRINTVMLNKNKVEGFEHNVTHKSYKVTNLADTSASIF